MQNSMKNIWIIVQGGDNNWAISCCESKQMPDISEANTTSFTFKITDGDFYKLTAESDDERIVKISKHLAKLWTEV